MRNKFSDCMGCRDGSDEDIQSNGTIQCGSCKVKLHRLSSISECQDRGFPECDTTTCYTTPSLDCAQQQCNLTDVICTSHCDDENTLCRRAFQCADGNLILASQFCDGVTDCLDNSDEWRSRPGFKCAGSNDICVLPLANLHDDVAQCSDSRDLCRGDSCFECLDKQGLKINKRQLCDGYVDCYDFSDECLCETNMRKENCDVIFTLDIDADTTMCTYNKLSNRLNHELMNNSPMLLHLVSPEKYHTKLQGFFNPINNERSCETKNGRTVPTLCDGRPECRDYSDECNCENRPSFCNNHCLKSVEIGDRLCDGIEDEVWKHINNSECPRGFDEKDCPNRFYCKAGDKVSIDQSQICDGVVNCDDGSDEQAWACARLFSSATEMIDSKFIRAIYWIVGILVVIGNFVVIASTTRMLQTSKLTSSLQCQHLIVLNISVADFIMGIYLLTIASFSVVFSGYYGEVDHAWRTSLSCSVIGSMAIVSSEASCFLMLILAAFRLYNVYKPIAAISASTKTWKIWIALVWVMAFILGTLPILPQTSSYFMHSISFRSPFNPDGSWMKSSLTKFACRYAALSNQTIENDGTMWDSTRRFLKKNFPQNFDPVREFGYYAETSVCMPRFYVPRGGKSWEFTLILITFNFLSFILIAVCYVTMFFETRKRSRMLQNKNTSILKREATMQKRIARIIATDFFSWVPICVLVYVRMSGIEFSSLACQISAVIILPINSALNPFLYSALPEKLVQTFTRKRTDKPR